MSDDRSTSIAETKCLNCGTSLVGTFCQACGQKRGAPPLALHDFVHEATHEFLHFDSKIWRTLVLLLFSPGALTSAYIAGQRVRYVGPVRLFLVASLVLFALLAALPSGVTSLSVTDKAEVEADLATGLEQSSSFERSLRRGALRTVQDPEHFRNNALKALSKSVFLLVPLFAFLTWRAFKKELPPYVAHLYFSLHFHAFVFLTLAFASTLGFLVAAVTPFAMAAFATALLAYFVSSLRRTFEPSWRKTAWAGAIVLVTYAFVNAVAAVLIMMGTLFLLAAAPH